MPIKIMNIDDVKAMVQEPFKSLFTMTLRGWRPPKQTCAVMNSMTPFPLSYGKRRRLWSMAIRGFGPH